MIKTAISILSADYMKFGEEIKSIEESGADYLHIDVMDGHFVPNITFGSGMVSQMHKHTSLPIDVHLMMTDPGEYIKDFANAGSQLISVHYEACGDKLGEVIELIKENGCEAGIVINPDTTAEKIKKYLNRVSFVLQMTVKPGFGGQKFIKETLDNIRLLNQWREEEKYKFVIEVDGGINEETAAECVRAGVDILVVGSFYVKATNPKKIITKLKAL